MNAIVAVCRDWGIGRDGKLLVRNRADMRHFVELTTGGTVIMGRKTLESFPGAKPLPHRRNIVITSDPSYDAHGAEVVTSVEDAVAAVASDKPEGVWVIGGESIYRQLLPSCDRIEVTLNDCVLPADSFFPRIDEDPSWALTARHEGGITDGGVPFAFLTYERMGTSR